jgi:hypothetical protein
LVERPHSNGQISIVRQGPLREFALVRRPTLSRWNHFFMEAARKNATRKSRRRPTTGKGIQVGERWSPGTIDQIDDWRRQQLDPPGRPEAIRRLVEIGLKAKAK